MSQGMAALGFLAVSLGIVLSMLVGARLLRMRPRDESPLKRRPYECGEEPVGSAWLQFHARYYLVALFFVLFDLEAVFLFPWGATLRGLGDEALAAMLVFVGVLLLGWLYGLRKGALKWQ